MSKNKKENAIATVPDASKSKPSQADIISALVEQDRIAHLEDLRKWTEKAGTLRKQLQRLAKKCVKTNLASMEIDAAPGYNSDIRVAIELDAALPNFPSEALLAVRDHGKNHPGIFNVDDAAKDYAKQFKNARVKAILNDSTASAALESVRNLIGSVQA